MGGGGESAVAAFEALKPYLLGHDPARLEEMRFLIANPTASLYNNRTQMLAALEFACLDILGQKWGVPCHEILGGRLRDRVPFASYLFFRYPNATAAARSAPSISSSRRRAELKRKHGFTTHKLKGGVFHPDVRARMLSRARRVVARRPLPLRSERVWSTEQAIWFGKQIEDLNNDYLEDPVFGLHGMRRTREKVRMPLATNTVVVGFEQLAANVLAHGGRRDSARHDVLGRHSAVREGGRDLRDVPARRRRAFVGRAGNSARDDAASRRGDSESHLRGRRALSPSASTT